MKKKLGIVILLLLTVSVQWIGIYRDSLPLMLLGSAGFITYEVISFRNRSREAGRA